MARTAPSHESIPKPEMWRAQSRSAPVRKGIAVTDDAVWVANSGEQSVDRIDPRSGDVVATIPVGDGPNSIVAERASGLGQRRSTTALVDRIDSANNRNTATITTGSSPRGLVPGRLQPLRLPSVPSQPPRTVAERSRSRPATFPAIRASTPPGTEVAPDDHGGAHGLRRSGRTTSNRRRRWREPGPGSRQRLCRARPTAAAPCTFTLRGGVRYSTGKASTARWTSAAAFNAC